MAQQIIDVGAAPNDGEGDPIRTAFIKTNDNFTELYAGGASTNIANGTSNVNILQNANVTVGVAGNTIATFASTGLYTNGLVSSTGNVQAGNLRTTGTISSSGNIFSLTALRTAGVVSAAGNITTAGYFVGTFAGNISGNITVAGSNTQVIFNNEGNAGATAGFTFDSDTNTVATTGVVTAIGNISGGNLRTGGIITATGSIITSGSLGIGNTAPSYKFQARQSANLNLAFGTSIQVANGVSIVSINDNNTQNIPMELRAGTARFTVNNSDSSGGYLAFGSDAIEFARFLANGNFGINNTAPTTSLGVTGAGYFSANVTGGNLLTDGLISATGNITGGNVSVGNAVVANVNATNALISGIASVAGNVSASYYFGNGSQLTGVAVDAGSFIYSGTSNIAIRSSGGNATVTIGASSNVVVWSTAGEYVSGLISASANVTGGNLLTSGLISATGSITVNSGDAATAIINGGSNAVGNIGSSSKYFNTVYATATTALYADLAEMYLSDAAYEPGTVVSFGGDQEITMSSQDSDPRIAGVISTRPAYRMNSGLEGDLALPVALTGRVPCSVTGSVSRGDMMVSAGGGAARAEINPAMGTVIGKALQDFDGAHGMIEIVVGRL